MMDRYGREVPKHAHGSIRLPKPTSSTKIMNEAIIALYDRIVNPALLIRRLSITTNHVVREENLDVPAADVSEQLDLFTDYEALAEARKHEADESARERRMQETILAIKKRYGKNSVLKGLNYADGATAKDRNKQIGGHKA
jgi:DNA polymerase V